MTTIVYRSNTSNISQIEAHLMACDQLHQPALSSLVSLSDYAEKLYHNAFRFEAWDNTKLVGLVAVYMNNPQYGFVSNVSVMSEYSSLGIASHLMKQSFSIASQKKLNEIHLEIELTNAAAQRLYQRLGFFDSGESGLKKTMKINLKGKA